MIKKVINEIAEFLPLRFGLINIVLVLIQAYYIILYSSNRNLDIFDSSIHTILFIIYGFVTLNILIQLLNTLAFENKRAKLAINLFLFLFINLLYAYNHNNRCSLDFSVLIDNAGLIFYRESLDVVIDKIGIINIIIFIASAVACLLIELYAGISLHPFEPPPYARKIITSALIYSIIIIAPADSFDEATYFFKSIYHYYFLNPGDSAAYGKGIFPFQKDSIDHSEVSKKITGSSRNDFPNIFLILMESSNANYIEKKTSSGVEYTPVFNSISGDGVYIKNFYGNSIQTVKGHFPTFFSLLPLMRGKVYTDFPDTDFHSLPEVLQHNGYDTIFMQANWDIDFDNTRYFLSKNGFSTIKSVKEYLKGEDGDYLYKWGPDDLVFYKRFFDFLDVHYRNRRTTGPVFAALATAGNHMRFDHIPYKRRFFYKDPKSIVERYANSIYLADRALMEFFSEFRKRPFLKNSIIIITGDHSYPMGEHGITENETGFYNESFRIPFVLIWKDRIKPERIENTAYSQLDLAPTILDMLGLHNEKNHFLGKSVFKEPRQQDYIYLIQPYCGTYLSVLNYPLKYIKNLRTGKEYFFNLVDDPEEKNNLISAASKGMLKEFRDRLQFIYLNEELIKMNNVWQR